MPRRCPRVKFINDDDDSQKNIFAYRRDDVVKESHRSFWPSCEFPSRSDSVNPMEMGRTESRRQTVLTLSQGLRVSGDDGHRRADAEKRSSDFDGRIIAKERERGDT